MQNVLYSEKYNLGFISNPKVACSTIKYSLLDGAVNGSVHKRELFGHMKQVDVPLFAVVRNPFSRCLSAFINKVGPDKDKRVWQALCKRFKLKPDQEIDFTGFLKLLVKDKNSYSFDMHFRPQHFNLHAKNITPCFLGRIERMEEVSKFLAERGVTLLNKSGHKTNASQTYKEQITPEQANLIAQIYSEDFDLYGYSKDLQSDFIPPSLHQKQTVNHIYEERVILNRLGLSVGHLIDLAIAQETHDVRSAHAIMSGVLKHRPNGTMVRKRLKNYEKRLGTLSK